MVHLQVCITSCKSPRTRGSGVNVPIYTTNTLYYWVLHFKMIVYCEHLISEPILMFCCVVPMPRWNATLQCPRIGCIRKQHGGSLSLCMLVKLRHWTNSLAPPPTSPYPRYPAEEGAGAEGAGSQEGTGGQRRGHHPVAAHRRGVQRVRRRLGARRERVVRLRLASGGESGGLGSMVRRKNLGQGRLQKKNPKSLNVCYWGGEKNEEIFPHTSKHQCPTWSQPQ